MGKFAKIARRSFLLGSTAVAGGMAFGFWKLRQPFPNPLKQALPEGSTPLGEYILLSPQGVTLITPRGEMGQGVQSALAVLLAEELELAWEDIAFAHGPPAAAYYNSALLEDSLPVSPFDQGTFAQLLRKGAPLVGRVIAMQVTGGSSSMPDNFERMRAVGAVARETLKRAAAKRWSVGAESLTASQGKIVGPNGKSLAYSELAGDLSGVQAPSEVALKPREQWKYIGKSMPRLDIPAKVMGSAMFSADHRPEGLVFAAVRLCPARGKSFKSYESQAALAVAGVSKIVELDRGLAVVARDSWAAMQGAKALVVDWEKPSYPASIDEHFERCKQAIDQEIGSASARDDGDCELELQSAETLRAEYRAPYLAHACMEPVNATARVESGRLEMWVGQQSPTEILKLAESKFGIKASDCEIHVQYMGGGFGRKLEVDYCDYAIQAAKALPGKAVQLLFSRSEDLQQDFYRPLALCRASGRVKDKKIHALDLQVACPSIMASMANRGNPEVPGADFTTTMTLNYQPYEIPNYRARGYRVTDLLPVASWRSVGASQNAFFHESMLDELIQSASLDPLQARLDLVQEKVCREVLEAVGELSNWGSPPPEGIGRGLAFWVSFGVPCAQVVEVQQSEYGIKVNKVYAVADPGIAVDPRNVEAQIFSGINFGLGSAIYNEITLQGGRVRQSNFHDFAPLRLHQAPQVEIRILQNNPSVRGMGEPAVPPAAPALGNAIFALTQKRLREMPFAKALKFV